ncbi:MAG: hypothetical protein SVV03_05515 [Candidatus Nanohaloarchaea archaeon]|nr:hypothetical protein [Candidatus Nanohaloarchaea archaeon]
MTRKKKGFYFSFDALLALSVVFLSTIFILGGSAPEASEASVESTVSSYRRVNSISEDSTQLATRISLGNGMPENFVDDYIRDTVLENSDRNKSVLDAIAILWASDDLSTAENISMEFFNGTVPDSYDYRISTLSDGNRTVIHKSGSKPSDVEFVANAKRLVSGVQKNKPDQGYLARARATKTEKNTTEVFGMPMMGSAVKSGDSHALEASKKFKLNADHIYNATLFLSLHTGGSDPNSIDVKVNGDDAGFPDNWDYEVDKDGNKLLFHSEEVTSLVESGWNKVFVTAKNTGGADAEDNVHFHPGAKMKVKYKENGSSNLTGSFEDKKYFSNVKTVGHNSQDHGVWALMPYYIPQDADVKNVTLNLHALDVDEVGDRNETQVYLNNRLVNATSLCDESDPGTCNGEREVEFSYNLTNETSEGTNTVAVYIDTFLNENKTITSFGDEDNIELFSNPEKHPDNSSYLKYSYEREKGGLVFGKIELTRTERFGGSRSNPKSYSTTFNQSAELLEAFVNLAQLDNKNTSIKVNPGSGVFSTAFSSPREFVTPTKIFLDDSFFDTVEDVSNTVEISDECTVDCSILPETSFERHILIDSQVGYGDTFQNRTKAVEDAKERLNETLGPFIDVTKIKSESLSVNNVPWLFGPVTVEMEVWKK